MKCRFRHFDVHTPFLNCRQCVPGAVVALRSRGTGLFGCGPRTREGAAILTALQQLVDAVNSDKPGLGPGPGLSSLPKGVSLGESPSHPAQQVDRCRVTCLCLPAIFILTYCKKNCTIVSKIL